MRLRLPHLPTTPPRAVDDREPDGLLDDAPEWVRVVAYALGAAFFSASIIVTIVFAGWLASASSSVPAGQAISLGLLGWLFSHGVPLNLGRGSVGLIPWLLSLLPLLTLRWSAHRLLTPAAERRTKVRPEGWVRSDVVGLGLGFAGVYTLIAFLTAVLARLPGASAQPLLAALCAFVFAVLALVWACADLFENRLDRLCPRLVEAWRDVVPGWLRRGLLPAVRGAAALLVMGAVAVMALIGGNATRVWSLYADLDPGWVGGAVLTLGQLLYLPTAAAWAVSVAAGPGFAIGTGPGVSVRAADGGALPLIPVFGALPDPGPLPDWFALVMLVPVAVGAIVGWSAVRTTARLSSWRYRAVTIAAACVTTGLLVTAVFALCSGGLGYERLGRLGVSPLVAGAALTGELLAGGLLAWFASAVRVRRIPRSERSARRSARRRRAPAQGDADEPATPEGESEPHAAARRTPRGRTDDGARGGSGSRARSAPRPGPRSRGRSTARRDRG